VLSASAQCFFTDYSAEEMLANFFAMVEPLLALAAALLRPGGRLVYLFPTFHTQVGLGSIVANVLPLRLLHTI
jgi:hypothetical protein